MARFSGLVGFALTEETAPGVWKPRLVERPYKGDIKQDLIKNTLPSESINQDVVYQNRFDIVIDQFFREHQHEIKYVKLRGVRWTIGYIEELGGPRVTIRFGGVYNGPTP